MCETIQSKLEAIQIIFGLAWPCVENLAGRFDLSRLPVVEEQVML